MPYTKRQDNETQENLDLLNLAAKTEDMISNKGLHPDENQVLLL